MASNRMIYTHKYYDEQQSAWLQLKRLDVDTIQHIVISQTTHFTDFLNAVIRLPDMPEVSAFAPTQLADMSEPHPLVGVPMIDEPQANTYGTAKLTYPIAIPSGRNGLQPDINLHYSSGNGNGILGYGWTLPLLAITIDTRWGVPRYSADYETEIYSADGRQMVIKDGNAQTTAYGIDADAFGIKRLMQQHTDENLHTWTQFSSPQGWITTSVTPDNATTTFVYDALGQLLSSTDPDGLTTTHTYDGYGHRIQRTNPDAGTTRWTYNHAGNIISTQTQSQTNNNQATSYHYTFDRLDSVCYPLYPQTNIYYTYDSAGRITQRKDLTGIEYFQYDPFGNISASERLIAIPTHRKTYRFRTLYHYDVFGKICRIFYPDNSVVRYQYAHGLLENIGFLSLYSPIPANAKSPPTYTFRNYISDFQYDQYDRPVAYQQADFTTELTYDSNRLWLTNKHTHSQHKTIQDLDYDYDAVGNITAVMQSADSIRWIGGAYLQEFRYDTQNRLTRADMLSDYFGEYNNYNFTYSPSGMVGIKSCDDMLWNYWYGYCWQNNHIAKHQVRSIYDLENDETTYLLYTPEGQLRNIFRPRMGDYRNQRWTEAGQLLLSVDNQQSGFYAYDGNGERVYKLTGTSLAEQYDASETRYTMLLDDVTLYVNPYFIVTPKGYTKHIFNGSQRVATHLGTANLQECIDTTVVGRERLQNARTYINLICHNTDEIPFDNSEVFVDIEGDDYDELQWQCLDFDDIVRSIDMVCDSDMLLPTIMNCDANVTDRYPIYLYHTDHLDSATWITDYSGNVRHLAVRPIYHRLINRIEGHICICFTAYTIMLELERMLKTAESSLTVYRDRN